MSSNIFGHRRAFPNRRGTPIVPPSKAAPEALAANSLREIFMTADLSAEAVNDRHARAETALRISPPVNSKRGELAVRKSTEKVQKKYRLYFSGTRQRKRDRQALIDEPGMHNRSHAPGFSGLTMHGLTNVKRRSWFAHE